jgi:protein-disulfide isomerase
MSAQTNTVRAGRWQSAITLALVAGAVFISGLAVQSKRHPRVGPTPPTHPRLYPIPDSLIRFARGSIVGSAEAPITLVEFSDFQCPYCAQLATVLDSLRVTHHDSVRIVYRHLPLTEKHPAAFEAAVAAECAHDQGHFKEMHDQLFSHQAELGRRSWWEFARQAGVPDSVAFALCRSDSRVADRVQKDIVAAERLSIKGTPNLLLGGVRVEGFATLDVLDSLMRSRAK